MKQPETVVPGNVCAAVFRADSNAYVSVHPKPVYDQPDQGYRLWEYEDNEGNVRACLLHVSPGKSAGWRILKSAEAAGYFEVQKFVAGSGVLEVNDSVNRATCYNLESISSAESARILPGNTFRVTAAEAQDLGAYVLAVFPGSAFQLDFEEPVF